MQILKLIKTMTTILLYDDHMTDQNSKQSLKGFQKKKRSKQRSNAFSCFWKQEIQIRDAPKLFLYVTFVVGMTCSNIVWSLNCDAMEHIMY